MIQEITIQNLVQKHSLKIVPFTHQRQQLYWVRRGRVILNDGYSLTEDELLDYLVEYGNGRNEQ